MEEPQGRYVSSILKWSGIGKQIIAGALMAMMFLLVAFATLAIVVAFGSAVVPGSVFSLQKILLNERTLLDVLGLFLTVLIALELIETVEVYFRDRSIHVEIVVLVAIIALARKVIILDLTKYDAMVLFALGFLILSLGATYFFVKRAAPAQD